jgi:pilus assembly protein FimV
MALALGVASQAQAIGLGAIEVKSQLGKPFVAEIPITLSTPNEADNLTVHLASPEAFARVGLERPNDLSANLQFSVGKNSNGQMVVRISTPQAMTDPYVSFLLEADWGRGKMVREYTALLDPPRTTAVRRVPIMAPVVQSTPLPAPSAPVVESPTVPAQAPPVAATPANPPPEPPAPSQVAAPPPEAMVAAPMEIPPPIPVPPPPATMPEPVPEPAPITSAPAQPETPAAPAAAEPGPAPVAATPEPVPPPAAAPPPPEPAAPAPEPEVAAAPAPAKPDTHKVAPGETLAQIAGGRAHGDVTLNRMMIALQHANPDAFIHQNINLLKSGSVLRIPANEEVQTLSADEANLLVQQQVESWHGASRPALQAPAETGEIARPAKPEQASATAASPEEAKPEAAKPEEAKPAAPRAKPKPVVAKNAHAKPSSAKPATEEASARKTPENAETAAKPAVARASKAHLEIVPPAGRGASGSQTGASAGGSGSELRAELAQTKEDLAARNAEVSELKSRVADLEKMQKDNQTLLSMKDSKLAAMEQRLAELEKKNSEPAPPASAASTASPAATAVATPPSPAANASTSSMAAATVTPASAPKPNAASKAPVVPLSEQGVEPPWYQNPLVLTGGGLLLLGGLLGLLLRGRRPVGEVPRANRYDSNALAATMASARSNGDADGAATTSVAKPVSPPAAAPAAVVEKPAPTAPAAAAAAPVVRRPYWTGAYDVDQKAPAASDQPAEPAAAPPDAPVATPKPAEAAKPVVTEPEQDDWGLDTPAASPTAITKERPAAQAVDLGDQGVATKMELARAYIDIGDAEGARGMLEEVLMEGNDSQREDALKLLETLD